MRLLKIAFDDIHEEDFHTNKSISPSKYIIYTNSATLQVALEDGNLKPFVKYAWDSEQGDEAAGIPVNSPWSWENTIELHLKRINEFFISGICSNLVFQSNMPYLEHPDQIDESKPIFVSLYFPEKFNLFYYLDHVVYDHFKILKNDDILTFNYVKQLCVKHNIPVIDESQDIKI
jgi:hypothetical protein